MASIKNLKKEINNVLGDIIDECLFVFTKDVKKSEAIIDEIIVLFDELIAKVHAKPIENKKAHFNAIKSELEKRATALLDKVNAL